MRPPTSALPAVLADPSFRLALKKDRPARRPQSLQRQELGLPDGDGGARAREGKTIGQLAREERRHPWDVFLDFGLDGELDALFDCQLFNIDEAEVQKLLRHPNAAVALSDAGAHLSFLCDAGFGLHLFGHWVRERGNMTLEQAVRSVTSAVAGAYRIVDRGALIAGAWADLMLFDPTTVARGPPRERPADRGGARHPAVGLHGVWVNGVRTANERGVIPGCGRPGRLLRDFPG
jgi:N-acyl-D-aspartate/D-glutamate deacylase